MKYTQNEKIMQVTEETLIVGIDIGKRRHHARVFDWRGIELSKKIAFPADQKGFTALYGWMMEKAKIAGKTKIIVGLEPTGHTGLPLPSI